MAFAVRTNVAFDGKKDDDSPIQGCAITFDIKDFLHIKVRSIFFTYNLRVVFERKLSNCITIMQRTTHQNRLYIGKHNALFSQMILFFQNCITYIQ